MKPFKEPIYVTKPVCPPIKLVQNKIAEIFNSGQFTNSGPESIRFEEALKKVMGVQNVSVFCNGTTALQTACHVLQLTGEVITTPFTLQ